MNRNLMLRDQLFSPLELVFDDFFSNFWKNGSLDKIKATAGYPKMDIGNEGRNFVIRAAVPGVNAEDLKIELENSTVRISGRMAEEYCTPENHPYYVKELCKRTFSRTITLPENVSGDPEATIKDGILVLKWEIPEEVNPNAPRIIQIKKE
jgi:HSP20 family protein